MRDGEKGEKWKRKKRGSQRVGGKEIKEKKDGDRVRQREKESWGVCWFLLVFFLSYSFIMNVVHQPFHYCCCCKSNCYLIRIP